MTTLTIGVTSELALPADVLQHLGAAYGGKLRLRLTPDGRRSSRPIGPENPETKLSETGNAFRSRI